MSKPVSLMDLPTKQRLELLAMIEAERVPSGWIRCAGCKDWTPPIDIVDRHCSTCNDARLFAANAGWPE